MFRHAMMLWVVVSCVCMGLSGCMRWFIGDPHRHAYVTRMGDADTMGKWTMQQADGQRIFDGLCALSERLGSTRDEAEAQTAMDWFLRVVNKIEDWPEDRIVPNAPGHDFTTRGFLRWIFDNTAFDACDNPREEELLHRLRPNERHRQWLGEWEGAVATVEEQRRLIAENIKARWPATTERGTNTAR